MEYWGRRGVELGNDVAVGQSDVRKAVEMACILEAMAPKAGNVTPFKAFHDTTFLHFVLSALAIGPVMERGKNASLGELVLDSVRETKKSVGVNTNLGIILMLAPLVKSVFMVGSLRSCLAAGLDKATLSDAKAFFKAISMVSPGGLGEAEEGDVKNAENRLTLHEAMLQASQRDSIASEYVSGFDLTFSLILPTFVNQKERTDDILQAITQTQLLTLSELPDTLIARKVGKSKAEEVSLRAKTVVEAGGVYSREGSEAFASFDRYLRRDGNKLNPGTTADLLAAAIFIAIIKKWWKV